MKKFINRQVFGQAIIINILCIFAIILASYFTDLIDDPDDVMGANIGAGLMILISPIVTCCLIGLYRGKKNKPLSNEIWLTSFITMFIIEIIAASIYSMFLKTYDLFLISTLSIPFDSIIFIFYFLPGWLSEILFRDPQSNSYFTPKDYSNNSITNNNQE